MRLTYCVAASLDGYIATPDGSVEWLDSVGESCHSGYTSFFDSVDGLVMGRNSYDFVCNSGYPWPYEDKLCWVMTSRELDPMSKSIITTQATPAQIVAEAKSKGLSHLWIVGGAETASAFLNEKLLESIVVSVIPILLSEGIPLFAGSFDHTLLKLHSSRSFGNGIVESAYDVTPKQTAGHA